MEEEWLCKILGNQVRARGVSVELHQGPVGLAWQEKLCKPCNDEREDQSAEDQRDNCQSERGSIVLFDIALNCQL